MQTRISVRENIIEKLNFLPENKLEEVDNFIQYIIYQYQIAVNKEFTKEKGNKVHLSSEAVLAKDWLTNEEEEAWKSL